MREYQSREGKEDVDEHELEQIAAMVGGGGAKGGPDPDQEHFAHFQARIDEAKGQVLRYCFTRGAVPLWPVRSGVPRDAKDIPPCSACGGPRRFEFQILPHLVHYLGQDPESDDAFDFGSIAIYSCEASCIGDNRLNRAASADTRDESHAYMEEFAWVLPAL